MCLSRQEEINLRVNKDGYIHAWKVISKDNGGDHYAYKFKLGVNLSKGSSYCIKGNLYADWSSTIVYPIGFHCFTNRKEARYWKKNTSGRGEKIIKVYVKPEDVITTGCQGSWGMYLKCLVTKRIEIRSLENCR